MKNGIQLLDKVGVNAAKGLLTLTFVNFIKLIS